MTLSFVGGLAHPLLNLEFCTISTGSIVEVNRLMEKMLENFGSFLSILS